MVGANQKESKRGRSLSFATEEIVFVVVEVVVIFSIMRKKTIGFSLGERD